VLAEQVDGRRVLALTELDERELTRGVVAGVEVLRVVTRGLLILGLLLLDLLALLERELGPRVVELPGACGGLSRLVGLPGVPVGLAEQLPGGTVVRSISAAFWRLETASALRPASRRYFDCLTSAPAIFLLRDSSSSVLRVLPSSGGLFASARAASTWAMAIGKDGVRLEAVTRAIARRPVVVSTAMSQSFRTS
jgi:hypothetical protein